MKLRTFLIHALFMLVAVMQAFYVSALEGMVLWLLGDLVNYEVRYWISVLICFIPNYIYTAAKTYQKTKNL